MTLKERVEKDEVGMRWFRTAVTTMVATGTLIGMMWAGANTLLSGFEAWVVARLDVALEEHREQLDRTEVNLQRLEDAILSQRSTTAQLGDNVEALQADLTALAAKEANKRTPAWVFDDAKTNVSDGSIGGIVFIKATGKKLRECGRPIVGVYFINGNSVIHSFEDVSITDNQGRGVSFPPDPDKEITIRYTAVIPKDDNVSAGRANAFIELDYTATCPSAPISRTSAMQFRINGRPFLTFPRSSAQSTASSSTALPLPPTGGTGNRPLLRWRKSGAGMSKSAAGVKSVTTT